MEGRLDTRLVTHELGNAVVALLGYAELLQDGAFGPVTVQQAAILTKLRSAVRLTALLVGDLAAADGEFSLATEPVSLHALADNALSWVAQMAASRDIKLDLDVPVDAPVVMADGSRIMQVLLNLLRNALRHTRRGGTVTLRALPRGAYLRIEVADDGVGMAQETADSLFSGPVPSRPGLHGESPGKGVGLYVSRAIVRAHGGDIGLSTPGPGGCTVWFTLPFDRGSA